MDAPPAQRHPRVTVIIPARNEARNIGHVLSTLPADVGLSTESPGTPGLRQQMPRITRSTFTPAWLAR